MKITKYKARIPLGDEKKKYYANVIFSYGWGLFGQINNDFPNLIDLHSYEVDPGYLVDYPEKQLNRNSFLQIIEDNEDLWQLYID
jgi:hypothetical protein